MSHDTVVHRLVRPAMRRVAGTGITPNQITTLRLLTGLCAAAAFAQGGVLWPDVGGAVMLAAMTLDRADGELARLSGKVSQGGYRYDVACDCVCTAAAFLGMGWGARTMFGPLAALLGLIAGVSVAAVFWLINVAKLGAVKGYGRRGDGRVLFDADDAMFLVPALVWCGCMAWTVLIAATATPVVAIALTVVSTRRSRRVQA